LLEPAGYPIDHAEAAKGKPVAESQRSACVETDPRFAGHQRVVPEPDVLDGIRDDQGGLAEDGMGAEGLVPRGLGGVETDAGLEPLTFAVDEADERDGGSADACGDACEVVEGGLRCGVEEMQGLQCLQTCRLIGM
jgi:hypothetical protein